jgi:hypothetical protein
MKFDRSAHHHGKTKTKRTSSQRGKVNKKRKNKNTCTQKERNNRDYYRAKGKELRIPVK